MNENDTQPTINPGDRIKLIEMPDDPCPIAPGTLGTITGIGPAIFGLKGRQIIVQWDIDRSLMLVEGIDRFEVIMTAA
jgi:hypothetical protein